MESLELNFELLASTLRIGDQHLNFSFQRPGNHGEADGIVEL
jgi:hypothetical protein